GEVPLSKSFFLNSGIFYTEKGCSEKFVAPTSIPDVVNDVERTKRYGYLEIPLNLALKIDAGSVKPYVQAGTYVSYVIYDKISSETNIIDEIKDFDFDTKKMDFGINVGAGIEISSLQLGVNYEWGVVNLADINDEYHLQGEDFSAKNGVLSVSAAILF
ncbi:MAG: PorT family protein, partial [Bacteroidales bacterium]|nr:PorT family protein [Bacteroidales bacterium]